MFTVNYVLEGEPTNCVRANSDTPAMRPGNACVAASFIILHCYGTVLRLDHIHCLALVVSLVVHHQPRCGDHDEASRASHRCLLPVICGPPCDQMAIICGPQRDRMATWNALKS